jgi:hypothetical protein
VLNLAVVLAVALVAAQAKHTHERPFVGQPPNPSTAMSGPYQTLFRIQPPKALGTIQVPAADPTSTHARVIDMTPRLERGGCNMPIIAARPDLDPRMIVTVPEEVREAAKIRSIAPPPPCGHR